MANLELVLEQVFGIRSLAVETEDLLLLGREFLKKKNRQNSMSASWSCFSFYEGVSPNGNREGWRTHVDVDLVSLMRIHPDLLIIDSLNSSDALLEELKKKRSGGDSSNANQSCVWEMGN